MHSSVFVVKRVYDFTMNVCNTGLQNVLWTVAIDIAVVLNKDGSNIFAMWHAHISVALIFILST